MTSIVALRCTDGVVIAADSAVTFGGGQIATIEQHTSQKVRIVGNEIIVAGTGPTGLMQRFCAAVETAYREGKFKDLGSGIAVGKLLADIGIRDFQETHLEKFDFSALVAFSIAGEPFLCELDGGSGFQPEMKEPVDIWYVSMGVGQSITDPFLALLNEAFWIEGPPPLRGGIFTALWALKHVCKLNAGGVGDPIRIAVVEQDMDAAARFLTPAELAEHENVVEEAMRHLGNFKNILEGRASTELVPSTQANLS